MSISARKQREKEERIRLIVDAGLQVFARMGYHSTSMDLIADEAELGKATLYYYFKSKDDLLAQILLDGIQDLLNLIDQHIGQTADPVEKILKICDAGAEFFIRHPNYFQLYSYVLLHPSLKSSTFKQIHEKIATKTDQMCELFQGASENGLIIDVDNKMLLQIYGSMVMGLGVLGSGNVEPDEIRQKAELAKAILLKGIRRPQ